MWCPSPAHAPPSNSLKWAWLPLMQFQAGVFHLETMPGNPSPTGLCKMNTTLRKMSGRNEGFLAFQAPAPANGYPAMKLCSAAVSPFGRFRRAVPGGVPRARWNYSVRRPSKSACGKSTDICFEDLVCLESFDVAHTWPRPSRPRSEPLPPFSVSSHGQLPRDSNMGL